MFMIYQTDCVFKVYVHDISTDCVLKVYVHDISNRLCVKGICS